MTWPDASPVETPLQRHRRWRLMAALIAAPAAAALATTAMIYLILRWSEERDDIPIVEFMQVWLVMSGFMLAVWLVLGWPFHAFARARRWKLGLTYAKAGVALGLLLVGPAALVLNQFAAPSESFWVPLVGTTIIVLPMTILCAFVFWLVRRPDKDIDVTAPRAFE